MKMVEEVSGGDWSEYDPEVSEKFKKMVFNLATYKNNININVDGNRISISVGDITSVKTPIKRNSNTIYNALGSNAIAVNYCRNYSVVSNGVTYTYWYLPSITEWTKIVNTRAGGFLPSFDFLLQQKASPHFSAITIKFLILIFR